MFAAQEQRRERYCAEHREPWMRDVHSKRCDAPACDKRAQYTDAHSGGAERPGKYCRCVGRWELDGGGCMRCLA